MVLEYDTEPHTFVSVYILLHKDAMMKKLTTRRSLFFLPIQVAIAVAVAGSGPLSTLAIRLGKKEEKVASGMSTTINCWHVHHDKLL